MTSAEEKELLEMQSYVHKTICRRKKPCYDRNCITCLKQMSQKDSIVKIYLVTKYTTEKLTEKDIFIGRLKYPEILQKCIRYQV